ncbi:MAG: glycerol-3-phosphate dehydrogenase/oxidase [Gemmatimonadales bacterium]
MTDAHPCVRATVWDLASRSYDVLVVGGGVTGAGIAREAALRGRRVALVDRYDFAWGTSSRSSRLVHGGLRYLEHRQWHLVRESLTERKTLLALAPHLVRPLSFVFPLFKGDRVARWKLELGLTFYDLLASRGNVPRHRALSKRALLDQEPLLRERGLKGGALYWDAQTDDARLTLAAVRAAALQGARVANYACVTALDQAGGKVRGATVEDQLTGAQATIEARVVVNATGPWCDAIRRLEDPSARPLLAPTRGAHVMVPRAKVGHTNAITFLSPIDGRVMFVLPWGDRSYVGTTDTDAPADPDHVTTTDDDVLYLLRSANAIFPTARLAPEDVSMSWAGLRPLVVADGDGRDPGSRSREHRIVTGSGGMITVAGGKLTTFRRMAVEVMDRVDLALDPSAKPRPATESATEPLPGGERFDRTTAFTRGVARGLPESTVAHLIGQYGSEVGSIFELVAEHDALRAPVHPHHGAIGAEVVHSVRAELARRLDDVIFRRLSLAYETPDAGAEAIGTVAQLMGRELGWDESRRQQEIERCQEIIAAVPRGRPLS